MSAIYNNIINDRRKDNTVKKNLKKIYNLVFEEGEKYLEFTFVPAMFFIGVLFVYVPLSMYETFIQDDYENNLEAELKVVEVKLINSGSFHDYADSGWGYDKENNLYTTPVNNHKVCLIVNQKLNVAPTHINTCNNSNSCCASDNAGNYFMVVDTLVEINPLKVALAKRRLDNIKRNISFKL
ncbi:hypothetical protein H5203_18860 [Pseudoalteromonas sp. SG41-1]|uniref:hypothetical protein n=1 Tax=Pseudoalteromonas sp. SG41-1 TaxID=2760979 RepID=UPI0016019774|nr:hypothetical protein [Pseudoalteromonas sp. SG41-1]MBB1507530.1 hypothetical protein [Pseudoalteromonas sp. SG41-1]